MRFVLKLLRFLPRKIKIWIRFGVANALERELTKDFPKNISQLDEKNIKNCKLLKDRIELLKHLPQKAIVAEIGVYTGDYSVQIIEHACPRKLYLIDSWRDEFKNLKKVTEKKISDHIESKIVSLIQDNSVDALEKFEDNYFDWVYLDSVHSYSHTKRELEILSRKVKADGFICGHDYTKGVLLAWIRFGVIEAVNEFCVDNDYEFIYLTFERSRYLSYALRKIE